MRTAPQLEIDPLPDSTCGAVITGVNLSNLDDATWSDIEAAFYDHGLAIFPDQHLDAEALPIFAKRFGTLQGAKPEGNDRAHSISNLHKERRTTLTEQDPDVAHVELTRHVTGTPMGPSITSRPKSVFFQPHRSLPGAGRLPSPIWPPPTMPWTRRQRAGSPT